MTDATPPKTNLAVACTILAQLGGGKFMAMTGARQLIGSATALSFKIPISGPKGLKINGIRIDLQADDTYTVTFYRIYGTKVTTVSCDTGIYNDQLRGLVERRTDLTLTMPRIRGIA